MMAVLISVIIPFYHGNNYINGLFQMFAENSENLRDASLEVIIVKDSLDDNVQIPNDEYSFDYRVINNEKNQGIQKSRVIGLHEAKGDYVVFLDQDDKIASECLNSQLSAIGRYDFVVANGYSVEPNGEQIEIFPSLLRQNACLDRKYYYCFADPIRSVGQVMIKKTAIPSEWCVNILSNIGADDAYLWMLMLEKGKKGVVNPEHVFVYSGKSVSGDYELMKTSFLEVLDYLKNDSARWLIRIARHKTMLEHNDKSLIVKLRCIDAVIMHKIYYWRYWK